MQTFPFLSHHKSHPARHFLLHRDKQRARTPAKQMGRVIQFILIFSNVNCMRWPVYIWVRGGGCVFGGVKTSSGNCMDPLFDVLRLPCIWEGRGRAEWGKRVHQRPAPWLCELPAHRAESELSVTAGHSDVNLNIIIEEGTQRRPVDDPTGIVA